MNKKNIIFIVNLGEKSRAGRNNPYSYSIDSWKNWAKQYSNLKVIEWEEAVMDPNAFKITLQHYLC